MVFQPYMENYHFCLFHGTGSISKFNFLTCFHFYFRILTLLLSLRLVTGSHQLLPRSLYKVSGCLLTFHPRDRLPGAALSHHKPAAINIPDSCISYHYGLPFLATQGSPGTLRTRAEPPLLLAAGIQGAGLDPLSSSLRKTH